MPTNLYGPGDNYTEDSHVLPALIRRFEAKQSAADSVLLGHRDAPKGISAC